MSKTSQQKKPPELKVVFDTNTIWNDSSNALLNRNTSQLILKNSTHKDLVIRWYLPEIVVLERIYQMFEAGKKLLPAVGKLERLLGHNLAITEDIVFLHIREAVDKELKEHNINVIQLDESKVDWRQIILNSVNRRPPFEAGNTEKGFRDAIVLEALLQLIAISPVTPRICRIALVGGDKLMQEAASSRTNSQTNFRLVESLDDLQGLINTLVSQFTEEFVTDIQEKAEDYFFSVDSHENFFEKEDVYQSISLRYGDVLRERPENTDRRTNGTLFIGATNFLKKEGQRVYWNTKVSVEAKAFKRSVVNTPTVVGGGSYAPTGLYVGPTPEGLIVNNPSPTGIFSGLPIVSGGYFPTQSASELLGLTSLSEVQNSPSNITLTPSVTSYTPEKLVMTGFTNFNITWSVSVSTNKKLSAGKLEDIQFIDITWKTIS